MDKYVLLQTKKIVETSRTKEKDNMEGLSFDNILGAEQIDNLFADTEEQPIVEEPAKGGSEQEEEAPEEKVSETEKKTTEVVNPEDLFEDTTEKQPESVGSEKNDKEQGDTTTDDGGTSPENFYSSIANAMAVDGIFPNLDEETIKNANDPESFSNLIEKEIEARLDEAQLRIKKALDNGVEPDDIKMYEGTLNRLASIKESDITGENETSEQLRYQLITQDLLNRGFSREAADKRARRSIDSGNDIEDAKEALQSNKDYFQGKYNTLLDEAQKNAEAEKADRLKKAEKLKDSLLKDKQLMGDWDLSNDIRKKAYENITRPVYKDPETGEYLTALQKYQEEHPAEFLKYVGLFMTMTNNFKDFDSFAKGKVKKEVKKGVSELEKVLNGTKRDSNGSLRMVTTVKDDPEAFIAGNLKLAL